MTAFPISALVDAEDLRLALILCAIDPGIGGVLLRGDKGSGKTTAARGLASLLADDAPFVELPLGATEDRVVGSLDLQAAFAGGYQFKPGLLSAADGGVLYVDEVNLLADHLVDLLLDAAATGEIRVERDGVSEAHRSRFVLVGSMNPEEGELRPQLLDRFGLSVTSTTSSDPAVRAEAVRRRLAFDAAPDEFVGRWVEEEQLLRQRLALARPSSLGDGLEEQIGELCIAAGAEGLRADLVICRAAAALAGWEGRAETSMDQVRRVAPLALAHRRRTPWDDPTDRRAPNSPGPDSSMSSTSSGSNASDGIAGAGREHEESDVGTDHDLSGQGVGSRRPWGDDLEIGAPGGLVSEIPKRKSTSGVAAGRRITPRTVGRSGRLVAVRPLVEGSEQAPLVPISTLIAALERRATTGAESPLAIAREDLRIGRRLRAEARLVVVVVDASASMGASARIEVARDAVIRLLVDAYQKRDRVALVAFRETTAEVVLRPTGSVEVARKRLASIEVGGRTPLASGIEVGLAVALEGRHAGYEPVLVLISDGRATWSDRADEAPRAASLRAADGVKRAGIAALVVDCESHRPDLQLAQALAETMGGDLIGAAGVLSQSGTIGHAVGGP